jgi:hypothetical protein
LDAVIGMTIKLLKFALLLPGVALAFGVYTFVQFVADVAHMSGGPATPAGAALTQAAVNFANSIPPDAPAPPANINPSGIAPLPVANVVAAAPPQLQAPAAAKASGSMYARTNTTATVRSLENDARAAALTQRNAATRDAASSNDANVRRAAIQQLAQYHTPENINSLSQTLHDTDRQNRFLSVESLRLMGMNAGDPDGSIRTLLRNAIYDPDPTVAERARDALAELAESSQ